jgi:flagellar assembly protein FliH
MTYRVDGAGPPLHLWQFPELEAAAKSVSPKPVAPVSPAAADEIKDGVAEEQNSAKDHEPKISRLVEEQITKGYADGWDRGLAEGREKGYAEGVAAGTAAADAAHAAQAQRLAAIIDRLNAPLPELERTVEEAVAALALEVARCVIGSETSRSREYLVQLIREAVAKVPIEMGALRVVVNPLDLELIRELAPAIENRGVALVGDDAVEPGDCRVVADGQDAPIKDMRWRPRSGEGISQVDLSLATRWRTVMLALFEGE